MSANSRKRGKTAIALRRGGEKFEEESGRAKRAGGESGARSAKSKGEMREAGSESGGSPGEPRRGRECGRAGAAEEAGEGVQETRRREVLGAGPAAAGDGAEVRALQVRIPPEQAGASRPLAARGGQGVHQSGQN